MFYMYKTDTSKVKNEVKIYEHYKFNQADINVTPPPLDYKKAYDSMPQVQCLELCKINRTIRAFIRNSIGMWQTTLKNNFKPNAQVAIKCRIYPGDALSPLLFNLVDKTGYGYHTDCFILTTEWTNRQPPPLQGWHQDVCQE